MIPQPASTRIWLYAGVRMPGDDDINDTRAFESLKGSESSVIQSRSCWRTFLTTRPTIAGK